MWQAGMSEVIAIDRAHTCMEDRLELLELSLHGLVLLFGVFLLFHHFGDPALVGLALL